MTNKEREAFEKGMATGEYAFTAWGGWQARAAQSVKVLDGEVRLWDTQWMNIVNHDNSYRDWSKEDAVAHAVKMTEAAIARNFADGKLPPKKITDEPSSRRK